MPIFILVNKWFLDYYFAHTSQGYALYVPQFNLVLVLFEATFLVFFLWLSKRRYQFSLRTLLIIVTLFAVACSWFAVKMRQAKKQKEAVEAILKWGNNARIYYDWQLGASGNAAKPPIQPGCEIW